MMNDRGKSDRSVVPEKPPNNADSPAAEVVEGRDRAKGNLAKRDKPWTLSQPGLPSALERVGQAARQDRKLRKEPCKPLGMVTRPQDLQVRLIAHAPLFFRTKT